MPRNILDDIVRDKRDELRRRQQATPLASLEARCRDLPPARDFEEALRPRATGVGLIAEVKKASPSRGTLAPTLDPVALATTYARHGADAISVLTDEKYFHGHLDLLDAIRGAVPVPLLRKDFTLAEYQLWESRAAGADAVLLIVSILEASELRDLLQAAKGVGLAALVECHTVGELETALAVGARVVGINNRDLTTFKTRIETTLELLPRIPPGHIVVSESGFFTGDQVKRVAVAGAHAVLVGEALVTASDVPAKIRELRAVEAAGAVDAPSHSKQTLGAVHASSHSAGAVGAPGHSAQPLGAVDDPRQGLRHHASPGRDDRRGGRRRCARLHLRGEDATLRHARAGDPHHPAAAAVRHAGGSLLGSFRRPRQGRLRGVRAAGAPVPRPGNARGPRRLHAARHQDDQAPPGLDDRGAA